MIFKTSKQFLSNVSVGDIFWMVRENMGEGLVSIDGPYTLVQMLDTERPGNGAPTKKLLFTDSGWHKHERYIEDVFNKRSVATTSKEDAQGYYDKEKPRELTSRRLKRRMSQEKEYLKESRNLARQRAEADHMRDLWL